MASERPVLPLVGSRMVWPVAREPSARAAASIAWAMRSLTEPLGFCPSSLAQMRTPSRGDMRRSRTSGVLPIRSSSDS